MSQSIFIRIKIKYNEQRVSIFQINLKRPCYLFFHSWYLFLLQELKDPERGRGCGEAGRPGWQPRTQSSPAELEAGTEAAGEAAAQEHGGQEVALNIQASLSEIVNIRQIVISTFQEGKQHVGYAAEKSKQGRSH